MNIKILMVAVIAGITTNFAYAEKHKLTFEQRCAEEDSETDKFLYRSDFNEWEHSPASMDKRFAELYASPKRLSNRVFVEDGKLYAYKYSGSSTSDKIKIEDDYVEVPKRFIASVTKHIEVALERKYVEHIFFPDMGHIHLFFPQKEYESKYGNDKYPDDILRYPKILKESKLKMLYHSSEQLISYKKMDYPIEATPLLEKHRWRNVVRHLVGGNNQSNEVAVYSDNLQFTGDTYTGFGGNIYFSSNKNGCFAYKKAGKTLYFDLSLEPFGTDPDIDPSDYGDD